MDSPRYRLVTDDDDVWSNPAPCGDGYLGCPCGDSVHYHCPKCGRVTGYMQHHGGVGKPFTCEAQRGK